MTTLHWIAGMALAGTCLASLALAADVPAAAQAHIDKARALSAGAFDRSIFLMCTHDATPISNALVTPPPTKAFDNLYYVGVGSVGAWALTPSKGIILFDTLDNPQEAETYIIGGLKKLGLNPDDIQYIVVTHGHGDHYGGARYLQEKLPKAKVMMSAEDYALAEQSAGGRAGAVPAPRRDLVVTNGQMLTLGDTSIPLYVYPGHTPGAISTILTVKDHGTQHKISFLGGTSPPRDRAMLVKYQQSFADFTKKVEASGAEGLISNHPIWDGSIDKLAAIRANPNGPNPYLMGKAMMDRYAAVQNECIEAELAR